ncbi:MAG: hypothetical protein MJ186_07550, partial [Clostridia bacterium]|nr:hypothetical protein [Clostridia bacterium]
MPNLLEGMERMLDAAYGNFEHDSLRMWTNRANFIFIDGKPVSAYIAESLDSQGGKTLTFEKKMNEATKLILKALINGQRVTGAIPDPQTGVFKGENMAEFEAPSELADYAANPEVKQALLDELADTAPTNSDLSKDEITALEKRNIGLMENMGKFNLKNIAGSGIGFIKQSCMRDVVNDPQYNPQNSPEADPELGQPKTMLEMLKELKGMETMKLTLERQAFSSHVIGMAILNGAKPEDIFDPEKAPDILAAEGKKFYELCRNKDINAIMQINLDATQKIAEMAEKELKGIDYSDDAAISSPKTLALVQLCDTAFDMMQERDRNKEVCYNLLAAQQGETIKPPEDKAKYEQEYLKRNSVTGALSNLQLVSGNRRDLYEAQLGIPNADAYQSTLLPGALQAQFIRKIVSNCQMNNVSVADALQDKVGNQLYNLGNQIENGNAVGKEAFDMLAGSGAIMERRDNMLNMSEYILEGNLDKHFRFDLEFEADGTAVPVLTEKTDDYSRHTDHTPAEREFFTAEFVTPSATPADIEGEKITQMAGAVYKMLKANFDITLGVSGQERLYGLDADNKLFDLSGIDLMDSDGERTLAKLCAGGRLFAVKPGETVPVQIKPIPDPKRDFVFKAADCLDNEPKPVEYRWYHKLANALGLAFGVAQKAAYDNFIARSAILSSVRQVAESRKSEVTFEKISKANIEKDNQALEKKVSSIRTSYVNKNEALKGMMQIYGEKPEYVKDIDENNGYTKEQFDNLKEYNLGLATDPEPGNPPKVNADGKVALRNFDFTALAMSAAATPEIGGLCRMDSEDSKLMPPEMVVNLNHTMFMNDIALNYNGVTENVHPRYTIGRFFAGTMGPARDKAAEAIQQYQNGDNKALAFLIANGIAFAGRNYSGSLGTPSAANKAMLTIMNAYGEMMSADPELEKAVRAAFAEIKSAAAAKIETNRAEKEAFMAENGAMINDVRNKMFALHEDYSKAHKANDEKKMAEIVDAQHKLLEDNPTYVDRIQVEPLFDAKEELYKLDASLDMDETLEKLQHQRRNQEAMEKGVDAMKKLSMADAEGTALSAEEKESLMKDIIRGNLVEASEIQAYTIKDKEGSEMAQELDSMKNYAANKLLPKMDVNHPMVAVKDDENITHVSTIRTTCLDMHIAKVKRTAESPVSR